MVDEKLIQQARARIQSRSPNSFGIEPTNDELLNEISAIEQENRQQNLAEKEVKAQELDSRIEESQKSRALFGEGISPELKNYAYELFPSLNELSPKSEIQIPFAPDTQPEEQEIPEQKSEVNRAIAQASPQAISQVTPQVDQQLLENLTEEQEEIVPTEEDLDIPGIIARAREKEDTADYFKSLAKFRDAAMGVGLGRVPTNVDYSIYDEMKKRAQRPIQDVLLKNELTDKTAKANPDSDISKLMRRTLEEIGIDMSNYTNVSYSQLEKIYPSLANTIATKIAAEARKDQMALASRLRADAAREGRSAKELALQEKKLNELSKRTENVLKSEEYKLFNQTKPTIALLDEAMRKWDSADESYKETAQAAFMGYAKAAQQDSSVVRESDMKVLAGGVNYGNLGGLLTKLLAKGQGAGFNPQELEAFKAVVKTIQNVKRKDLQNRFQPILYTANQAGIAEDYLISPEIKEDIYSATPKEKDPVQERIDQFEAELNAQKARMEELRKKRDQ